MRKFIGVIIMVLVVGVFYFSLKQRTPVNHQNKDTATIMNEIEEKIDANYPKEAKGVIEKYNEITKLIYTKELKEGELEKLVELQRKLYESSFASLNSLEDQVELTDQEIFINKEKNIRLIKSEILGYVEKEDLINVEVMYYTNKYDLTREYILVEEEGQWKIYGWVDSATENFGLQEEEE